MRYLPKHLFDMGLRWALLFLSVYSSLAYPVENEAVILERDLQDFMRKMSQHQPDVQHSPRLHLPRFSSPQQFQPEEESISSPSGFSFPFQGVSGLAGGLGGLAAGSGVESGGMAGSSGGSRSFASSYASVKRPYGNGEASSQAMAIASVRDVNDEERLAENIDSEKSSTVIETHRTSPSQEDGSTLVASSGKGPYTLHQQQVETVVRKEDDAFSDVYFVAIVAGCCAVGIFGVISAGICFYRLQKSRKAAADVDYPAYGVTGPAKDVSSPSGDRKLAQSAQMYHYQHQKQQMIAVEKAGSTKNTSASDVDSEEENEEGDYTVYECPGLAPAGEMEVKNPLFQDDSTPVSPPIIPTKADHTQSN